MKNLMVICPHPSDGTSWYRGVGPFSVLAKQIHDLNLVFTGPEYNWDHIRCADVIFMQRPFSPEHLQLAEKVNACNTPLWLDYDDDLFAVPTDNPSFGIYNQEAVQRQIGQIAARADVITVTTEALKAKLQPLNKNIYVVPNALDDMHLGYRRPRTKRNKLCFWRGSATHERDLMGVAGEIVDTANMEEFKEWMWQFLNYNPWFITEQMPKERTLCSGGLSPEQYFRFLEELNPALQIVPLADNAFNRSKSNIAWIEGMFTGSAVIAPNIPEFKQPGVLTYDTKEEFQTTLRDCLSGKHDLEALNNAGWNHVKANYLLTHVNQKRAKILESLYRRETGFKS